MIAGKGCADGHVYLVSSIWSVEKQFGSGKWVIWM